MSDGKLLLKVPEAGESLGLSRSTIYELLAAGEIKAVKIGAAVRIPTDELRRYVERLKGEAA